MITEDYVSFEVAKLLKEKGFEEETWGYYPIKGDGIGLFRRSGVEYNHNHSQVQISAPTLQMALKWLREEHNIFIAVEPHCFDGVKATEWIFNYWHNNCYYTPYDSKHPKYHPLFGKTWLSYEEACEAAIKYCLTNLI